MLVVNLKAYQRGTGEQAAEIARQCAKAAEEMDERVVVAPQPADLLRIESENVEKFGQHMTPVSTGSHTGHVTAESLADAGAAGTLLNHSEKRMDKEKLNSAIEKADDKGLTTIVCAQSPDECKKVGNMNPDYVAFEPPELIGGETSVSQSKPGMISEAVERCSVPVLTGAGVKDTQDVSKSIELGCEGVLVASGIVKADDPYQEAVELMEGL